MILKHKKIKIFIAVVILIVFFISGFIITLVYDTRNKISYIKNFHPNVALKILDRKDRLIANVFEDQFREYASFNEISPKIIETLLAVEDTLFFEHRGVNFDALSRAMIKNIKSIRFQEGGSTITQQLVKNVVLSMEKTVDRKLKEIIIALQLERVLSKEEILEKYLNYIYFGHGYYGIKTAAQGYFNKELSALSLKEIAMLMALPKAPSYYDPSKNLSLSLSRANSILERMLSIGWINNDEFNAASKEVPKVYNQTLSQNLAPYVVDEVLRQLSYIKDLKTGGYVIKLNIDLDYQKIAQDALVNGYNNINSRLNKDSNNEVLDSNLNGAIVVTQSMTGNILALVGGVNYEKSNFNRATQARRQFGSTIKPFIYQIAFDMGYSQATEISDVARSFANEEYSEIEDEEEKTYWRPRNYTNNLNGIVTLKEALSKSLNLATLNLVDNIGFNKIYDFMSEYGFSNMQKDMSIILGSYALSPLEAIKEYSLFANYGTIIDPKLISGIIDPNGKNLMDDNIKDNIITTPEQAYLSIDILKNVVQRGTGRRAFVNGIELAGKTGTSNRNVDAWFSGFSPSLQVVIWYGRDDNTPIGENETGGVIAAPVFADFFKQILKIEPGLKRNFDIPYGVYQRNISGDNFYYTSKSKLPKQIKENNIEDTLIY